MTSVARNNWILMLISGGLSLLLFMSSPEPDEAEPQTLSNIDPTEITHIRLALGRPGKTALELQKTNDQWMLTAPIALAVDPLAINEILRLASSNSHRQLDPEDIDRGKLKLDPPLWRVHLDQAVFEVGGREAISGHRYVGYAGQVHLIDDLNTTRLDNNYADLVARDLLAENFEITALRLPDAQNGSRDLSVSDTGSGGIFKNWAIAKAQWLVRPSKLDYQDVHSRVTVFMRDEKGASHSIDFLIRSSSPQLELIRPDLDLMYMLPGSAADELLSLPNA
ncbi:MAG: DUF4340 domain-containing protein [Oceanococcus sp.]